MKQYGLINPLIPRHGSDYDTTVPLPIETAHLQPRPIQFLYTSILPLMPFFPSFGHADIFCWVGYSFHTRPVDELTAVPIPIPIPELQNEFHIGGYDISIPMQI